MQSNPSTGIEDTLALLARNISVSVHRHSAVQVVVSLDGAYSATLAGTRIPAVTGFIIDSNIPHACESVLRSVLVVSIDAFSHRGMSLRRRVLGGQSFRLLDDPACSALALISEQLRDAFSRTGTVDYRSIFSCLPSELRESSHAVDPRVDRAADILRQSWMHPPPMQALADEIGLSQRRLRQLFQAQIGSSIRRFVHWLRIKTAMRLLNEGHELSEVAYGGGFSDQAHLTRVCRQMFGISPAALRTNATFLEVFV